MLTCSVRISFPHSLFGYCCTREPFFFPLQVLELWICHWTVEEKKRSSFKTEMASGKEFQFNKMTMISFTRQFKMKWIVNLLLNECSTVLVTNAAMLRKYIHKTVCVQVFFDFVSLLINFPSSKIIKFIWRYLRHFKTKETPSTPALWSVHRH